jgi:hypothetical protein
MAFDLAAVTVPFRMQPGLRRLEAGTPQLTPNRPGDAALEQKLEVLARHADEAFVTVPSFDAGPALAAIVARAAGEHPQAFDRDHEGRVTARLLGWSWQAGRIEGDGRADIGTCLAALPASWRLAGLLSLACAEDFAVIDADGRIPWIAVCLPSNWAPAEKVGHRFTEVHAPVADNRTLLAAADHLARLVTAGERWERFVWTITDDPRLARHPHRSAAPRWEAWPTPESLAAAAYLRSERQTFLPVAGMKQAVFTIRVTVEPLQDAVASRAHAERLHAALASMSPAVLAYRQLAPARERLLAWLARQMAS